MVSAIFILNTQVAVSLISTIRDLHRRRARERRSLTLAEGVRLMEEALAAGVSIEGAAISPALEATARGVLLKQRLAREGVPLEPVADELLGKLADTQHPQGIVAVVRPPEWQLAEVRAGPRSVIVVLDAVQDPGNVGALARAALGLGAELLIALPGTADLINPRALRGSAGALFRLPAVHAETAACLNWVRTERAELWITTLDGTPVDQVTRTGPVALVFGNEGAGVGPELAAAAARSVAVPLVKGVESLNVAVAAGIILYEVTRER